MAIKHPTSEDVYNQNYQGDILIVRKEIVGKVTLSPDGTRNPLQEAFRVASEYLGENVSPGQTLEVEFFYGEHVWKASAIAQEEATKMDQEAGW